MAFDLNTLRNDPTKAEDGVWVKFDEESGGELLLRPAGNKEFEKKMARLTGARRKRSRNQDIPDEDFADIQRVATIGTVLMDWRGFVDNGKDVEFTPESAKRIMDDFPDLYSFILVESRNHANFALEVAAERKDNFPAVPEVAV